MSGKPPETPMELRARIAELEAEVAQAVEDAKDLGEAHVRLVAERDRYRDAIEHKVAQFLCPVHGDAHCPEEYMLKRDGTPFTLYQHTWTEAVRCGQRPTAAGLLAEGATP